MAKRVAKGEEALAKAAAAKARKKVELFIYYTASGKQRQVMREIG